MYQKLQRVLNKISPGFRKKTLHVWQGSEYSSGSEYTKILNMPGLHKVLKRCCIIDAQQDYVYSSGSEYGKVLNMSGLHKVLTERSIAKIW